MVCLGQMMIYLSIPFIFIPTFTFPLTWIDNFGKTFHPPPLPSLGIFGNIFPYTWVTIFLKFCISPYPADILNWTSGARDLRTLWSPPVSLNQEGQEGHTKEQSSLFFSFFLKKILFRKFVEKSPMKTYMVKQVFIFFIFYFYVFFVFFFCLFFTFIFLFIWMQVWSLEKEDTPHSFSSKVFLHYYKKKR